MNCRSVVGRIAAAVLLLWGSAGASANDEAGENDADLLAGDIVALTRLIGEQHREPPAVQQIVLLAARALHEARKNDPPRNLVARCSTAVTDDEFRTILKDACGAGFMLNGELRAAVSESIAKSLPGGLQLLSHKAGAAQQQLSENRYVGVGIAAKGSYAGGELEIGAVMPGGPVALAGIEADTVIRAIDGWTTLGQSMEEAIERLRGPEGTPVTITILRPGKDKDEIVTLYRGVVPQKMLTVDIQEESGRRIAVLKPRELGGSLAHEIRQFAENERHLDGVLLDLRGVYGRAHFAALVADQFLDGGAIGAIETGRRRTRLKAEPGEILPDVPLAIATDQATRGSAAWLATLLMERKRAVVFGQKGEHPNLDFETFELPSGDMATFATKVLVTPGGATTLVVSEETPGRMPNAAELVSSIGLAMKEISQPFGPTSRTEAIQKGLREQQAVRRALNRDSFVIAKEYLENLPAKKG